MTDARRGDVVLIAFPFIAHGQMERKRRPAVVVQADRYNRRRSAVIIAAITTAVKQPLPCKVPVAHRSAEGRRAGVRLDSTVDCQTIATVPSDEIVSRIGTLTPELMLRVDEALKDALGLSP
ncbi:MAG: type II toxin-antitoxin system PemK/MazF family toxin [Gemmatimonadales bacterium]|jgi:mRNA-degrading endonuclease toxin of MazEF toxin-antitoxin module